MNINKEIKNALELTKLPISAGAIIILGGKLVGFDLNVLEPAAIVSAIVILYNEMKSKGEI